MRALLAGELETNWALWWRMELFYLLVRLQGMMPVVPRFSFAGSTDVPASAE